MMTASAVVITLIIAFVISFFFVAGYYCALKRKSYDDLKGLSNTDICIANGVDEIKIICK